MIPLLHDFEGATVLVFGGGPVGARKARRFAREARVIVVAPEFADRRFGDADLVRARPGPAAVGGWIDRTGPALAVAATDDPAVNDAIERAARERGVLYNRADEAGGRDPGSVVVPATVRDDPVVVAVGTGGAAPALSRHLREELAGAVEGAGAMADALGRLRADLDDLDPGERRRALRAAARSERAWRAARSGGDVGAAVRSAAADVLPPER